MRARVNAGNAIAAERGDPPAVRGTFLVFVHRSAMITVNSCAKVEACLSLTATPDTSGRTMNSAVNSALTLRPDTPVL